MVTSISTFAATHRRSLYITLAAATALILATQVGAQAQGNQTPVIQSVSLRPLTFGDGITVMAGIEATDPEGDQISFIYQWFLNGQPIPGAIGPDLDLSAPGNGQAGDRISVGVVASDGHTETIPAYSPESPILNTAPSVAIVAPHAGDRIVAGSDYFVQWGAADPDGDLVSVGLWYRLHEGEDYVPLATVPMGEGGYHWIVPNVETPEASLQFEFSDGVNHMQEVVQPIAIFIPVVPQVPADSVPQGAIIRPNLTNIVVNTVPGGFNISWDTDVNSTGALLYDVESHSGLERAENYGYASRVEEGAVGTHHFIAVSGLEPNVATFFRVISKADEEGMSSELVVLVIEPLPPPPPSAPAPPPPPPPPIDEGTPLVAPAPVVTPEVVEPPPAVEPSPAPAPVAPEEPVAPAPRPPAPAPSPEPAPLLLEPFPEPAPPSSESETQSSLEVPAGISIESETPTAPTGEGEAAAQGGIKETISGATDEPGEPVSAAEAWLQKPLSRWIVGLVVLFVIWLLARGFRKPETPGAGYTVSSGNPTMPQNPSAGVSPTHQSTILPPPPPNA